MNIEATVARHYTHGSLERAIVDALREQGKDPSRLTPVDLAPIDEFHVGARQATIEFATQLKLRSGMRLLDIGCGLGGAARYFAAEHGCRVEGIDLTQEYVDVANSLARMVGLESAVSYRQASALDLPFPSDSFDGAYMIHVGMNIPDKGALFAGVRRVVKTGGWFGIYDLMRTGEGEPNFPTPWAASPESSFILDAGGYRKLLEAAGFEIVNERDRREFAVNFFRQVRARAGQGPALGIHMLMGAQFAEKLANVSAGIERGLIAPIEIICRAG
jgi:ubiquinone/menaquinone biosynthesis C-methylase UbiE